MSEKHEPAPPSSWERIRILKESADLRQVAAHLGLRQEGKHYFCPKCQAADIGSGDRKPELVILDRVFLCHRCGTGGDALTLIRLVHGGGFQGTLEYLERIVQDPTAPEPPPTPRSESHWKPAERRVVETSHIQRPTSVAPPLLDPEVPASHPQPSLFADLLNASTPPTSELAPTQESLAPAPPPASESDGGSSVSEELAQSLPQMSFPPASPERRSAVYAAFLSACWPLESARFVVSWLEERGLSVETATRLGMRLCGGSYTDLMERLEKEWGTETLADAGLLIENADRTGYAPAFLPYFKHSVAFLVVPYLHEGAPVYLKALPPIERKRAEELHLPPMISLRGPLPCLYNHDALTQVQGKRILFCERETDVLAAESSGFAAVGIPGWAHFKPEWVHFFNNIEVFLVLEEDEVALEGTRRIARFFQEAGRPEPKEIRLPAGCDLKDYLSA